VHHRPDVGVPHPIAHRFAEACDLIDREERAVAAFAQCVAEEVGVPALLAPYR